MASRRRGRTSPVRDIRDEESEVEEDEAPVAPAQRSYSFALVNWGSGGNAEDGVNLFKEVLRSCEHIVMDARSDVLLTIRQLGHHIFVAAITGIIAYVLVHIVPHF